MWFMQLGGRACCLVVPCNCLKYNRLREFFPVGDSVVRGPALYMLFRIVFPAGVREDLYRPGLAIRSSVSNSIYTLHVGFYRHDNRSVLADSQRIG